LIGSPDTIEKQIPDLFFSIRKPFCELKVFGITSNNLLSASQVAYRIKVLGGLSELR
jgi:hypothetical protein